MISSSNILCSIYFAFIIVESAQCQVMKDLNTIQPNVPYQLENVEDSSILYVSAVDDSKDVLSNIIFHSNGDVTNAYHLANDYLVRNSGGKTGWKVGSVVTVTTTNSADDMKNLAGKIYVTTAKQRQDMKFYVYDVVASEALDLSTIPSANVVFLNSNVKKGLKYSTQFTKFALKSASSFALYKGVPSDMASLNVDALLVVTETDPYTTIEDFSLTLDYFYIQTKGPVSFTIMKGNDGKTYKTATSLKTTGFFMNDMNQNALQMKVDLRPVTGYDMTVGYRTHVNLEQNQRVTIEYSNGNQNKKTNIVTSASNNQLVWKSETFQATQLTVTPSSPHAGEYYVQYSVIQKQQNNVQTAGPLPPANPTTRRPEATTKYSNFSSSFLAVFASILFVMFQ